MNKIKKKSVISVTVVLMLLAVSLYFVGGTYARYASEYSGNATGSIAAWKVKVNNQEPTSTTLDLTFTGEENEFVATDRIAPSSSISTTVPIDLTGTEVAVDIKATVDQSSIAKKFGESASQITVKAEIEGGSDSENYTVNDDGTVTIKLAGVGTTRNVKITVTWENSDEKNTSDTQVGTATDLSLELPVTITLQQHLATDNHAGN